MIFHSHTGVYLHIIYIYLHFTCLVFYCQSTNLFSTTCIFLTRASDSTIHQLQVSVVIVHEAANPLNVHVYSCGVDAGKDSEAWGGVLCWSRIKGKELEVAELLCCVLHAGWPLR